MVRTATLAILIAALVVGCGEPSASTQPGLLAAPEPQPPVAKHQPAVPQAPIPHSPLMGTWIAESAEALGKKAPDKVAGGMKLTFHPDKATWHFRLPDGWKSFDGTLRYDPTSEPKEIDLSQPSDPNKVTYGIYKIEGDTLTISMGAKRPKTFDEPSWWAKMVFRRE